MDYHDVRPTSATQRVIKGIDIRVDVFYTGVGMCNGQEYSFYIGSKFAPFLTNSKDEVVMQSMDSIGNALESLRAACSPTS